MVAIPENFSGQKFMDKYSLTMYEFLVQGTNLICPSLPDLTDADLLDCVLTQADLEEIANNELAIQQLREQYIWARDRLIEIQNEPNPSAVNLTIILRIIAAIKDVSKIVERLLRLLKGMFME